MIENTTPRMSPEGEVPAQADGKKTCIALMGEFSAGKTTLINFLIGADVLPTKITATQVPPVWLSYGEDDDPFYVDSENRSYPVDLMDIQNLDVKNVRYIKVFADSEFLKNFDLIDTPGISDPNIPEFHRDTATSNADAIIWCTHATQAWRESENSAWLTVPEALRARSLLVATRADKLDERNRERVKKRLHREAGELFDTILMFSAVDALRAKSGDAPAELMEQSGGAQLLKSLWKIAGHKGHGAPAPDDAEEADVPVAPRVLPTRVVNRQGGGRARISADEARSVRSQLLSATQTEEAGQTEAAPEPEFLELDTSGPAENGDLDDDKLFLLAPENRLDSLDSILDDTEEEDVQMSQATDDEADGAEEVDCHEPEVAEAPAADIRGRSADENTLSALKEILHQDIEDAAPEEEISSLLNVVEADDRVITPLELWGQVQREYEVDTIEDVMGAVSILIEVMQEHRICFAKCCQTDPAVARPQDDFPLSLSG